MSERQKNVYKAVLAEQAERYDEMCEAMKKVASMKVELTDEECNLLCTAYNNAIGLRRASWRIICFIEQKEEGKGDTEKLELIRNYRAEVEKELLEICNEILYILDEYILPKVDAFQYKVFFYKMKADFNRYMAEFITGKPQKDAIEKAFVTYKAAWKLALAGLAPADPMRLGLSLNFSVFYYGTLNSHFRACSLAEEAYNDGMKDLNKLSDDKYIESAEILEMMKDNLSLWYSNVTLCDCEDNE